MNIEAVISKFNKLIIIQISQIFSIIKRALFIFLICIISLGVNFIIYKILKDNALPYITTYVTNQTGADITYLNGEIHLNSIFPPEITIIYSGLTIMGANDLLGKDTLFFCKDASIQFDIIDLILSNEIRDICINNAYIRAKEFDAGSNYDLGEKDVNKNATNFYVSNIHACNLLVEYRTKQSESYSVIILDGKASLSLQNNICFLRVFNANADNICINNDSFRFNPGKQIRFVETNMELRYFFNDSCISEEITIQRTKLHSNNSNVDVSAKVQLCNNTYFSEIWIKGNKLSASMVLRQINPYLNDSIRQMLNDYQVDGLLHLNATIHAEDAEIASASVNFSLNNGKFLYKPKKINLSNIILQGNYTYPDHRATIDTYSFFYGNSSFRGDCILPDIRGNDIVFNIHEANVDLGILKELYPDSIELISGRVLIQDVHYEGNLQTFSDYDKLLAFAKEVKGNVFIYDVCFKHKMQPITLTNLNANFQIRSNEINFKSIQACVEGNRFEFIGTVKNPVTYFSQKETVLINGNFYAANIRLQHKETDEFNLTEQNDNFLHFLPERIICQIGFKIDSVQINDSIVLCNIGGKITHMKGLLFSDSIGFFNNGLFTHFDQINITGNADSTLLNGIVSVKESLIPLHQYIEIPDTLVKRTDCELIRKSNYAKLALSGCISFEDISWTDAFSLISNVTSKNVSKEFLQTCKKIFIEIPLLSEHSEYTLLVYDSSKEMTLISTAGGFQMKNILFNNNNLSIDSIILLSNDINANINQLGIGLEDDSLNCKMQFGLKDVSTQNCLNMLLGDDMILKGPLSNTGIINSSVYINKIPLNKLLSLEIGNEDINEITVDGIIKDTTSNIFSIIYDSLNYDIPFGNVIIHTKITGSNINLLDSNINIYGSKCVIHFELGSEHTKDGSNIYLSNVISTIKDIDLNTLAQQLIYPNIYWLNSLTGHIKLFDFNAQRTRSCINPKDSSLNESLNVLMKIDLDTVKMIIDNNEKEQANIPFYSKFLYVFRQISEMLDTDTLIISPFQLSVNSCGPITKDSSESIQTSINIPDILLYVNGHPFTILAVQENNTMEINIALNKPMLKEARKYWKFDKDTYNDFDRFSNSHSEKAMLKIIIPESGDPHITYGVKFAMGEVCIRAGAKIIEPAKEIIKMVETAFRKFAALFKK